MNRLLITAVITFPLLFGTIKPISSTSIVTVVGAHIKARDFPINTKYKRKDCPVCKGTGKYLSGDGIKEVDCGYCEE
jgi:hypothetical protein